LQTRNRVSQIKLPGLFVTKQCFVHLAMQIRLAQLFLYFLLFYLLWDAAIDYFNASPFFTPKSFTAQSIVLTVTSFISFFLYPLSVCFWFGRFVSNRPVLALAMLLACIPPIILFRYALQEIAGPLLWGFHNYYPSYTLKSYIQDNLYFAVLFTAFGLGYFFIRYTRHTERKQARLAIAAKEAELSFLKSQVNPHFLFNNLHNIYILIYQKNENALPAVEKLSSLLRYALYEQREKVSLETEINHLKDFIQLQRLRIGATAAIHTDLDNIDESLPISPHLLISFVENAFKHGDIFDPAAPLEIAAHTRGNTLLLRTANKKNTFNKSDESGIGLQNVKRRLDLLYGERHVLNISDTDEYFSITLSINL
jgi:two-component system, LytTR family, sensor kinase